MSDALPKTISGYAIAKQIIRSGTSVAANYRAALHARSKADFISKVGIVVEESDETLFWLELVIDSGLIKKEYVIDLYEEANELVAIFCAIQKTAKTNRTSYFVIRTSYFDKYMQWSF